MVTISGAGAHASVADTDRAPFSKEGTKGYHAASSLASYVFNKFVDTDVSLAANSDAKFASQKAVKAYVDAILAVQDAMVFKGVIDCSANPNYPAADRGHTYRVSVAGKIGGASGVNVQVGDLLTCITDSTASGNEATVGTAWTISQANIDGAVIGPASVTDSHFAQFDGTTGKLLKGGIAASAVAYIANDNAFTGRASYVVPYTTVNASILAITHGSSGNPVTGAQAGYSGVRVVRYLNKTQGASSTQEEGVQADALSSGSFILHATPGSQQAFALKGLVFVGTQRNSGIGANGDFVGGYFEAQRYGNYTDQIWALNTVTEWDTQTAGAVIGYELDFNNKSASDPGLANGGTNTGLSIVSGAEGRSGTAIWINRHGVYSNNEWNRGLYVKEYKKVGIQIGNDWHNNEVNAAILGDQNANGEYVMLFRRATDTSPTGTFIALVNAANSANLFTVDISGRFQINNPANNAAAFAVKQIGNNTDTLVVERATDTSPTGYFLRAVNAANNANIFYFAIDGRLQINNPSVITTAVIALKQIVNNEDTLFLQRVTDTSPTGNFIRCRNAANDNTPFAVSITGRILSNGGVSGSNSSSFFAATQVADGEDGIILKRFTDSSPTGQFLRAVNAANNANIIVWGVNGRLSINAPSVTAGAVNLKQLSNSSSEYCLALQRNTDSSPAGAYVVCVNAANSLVVFSVDFNVTAAETPLVISVGGNTGARVSVGANDSGGSGYKVLRVPNAA